MPFGASPARRDPGPSDASLSLPLLSSGWDLLHLLPQCEIQKGIPRALLLSLFFCLSQTYLVYFSNPFLDGSTLTGAHTPFLQATAYFPA